MAMPTVDDLVEAALAAHCSECGDQLPRRGEQCLGCGSLPETTRAEFEELLKSDPAAYAEAERKAVLKAAAGEAARLREEGAAHQQASREAFQAADLAEVVARLEIAAAEAGRELKAVREDERRAGESLAEATAAEQDSAAELADAEQAHRKAARDEEAARRTRKGIQAEIAAQERLDAAAKVLARHQAAHSAVAAARAQARQHLRDTSSVAKEREDIAARFAYAAEHCVRAPVSRETAFADVFALAARAGVGQLDKEDRLMVTGVVHMMAISLGVEENIRRDEEGRVRARDEAEKRNLPTLVRGSDGMLSAGWAVPPVPSGPDPGGHVNPPPPLPSTAGQFGALGSISPGIPGGGQVTKRYEPGGWAEAYLRPFPLGG